MDGSGSGCFWQFVGVLSVADASLECRAAARSCRMLPDALYALVAMLVRDFVEHRATADVDPRLQAEREGPVVAMRKKAALSRQAFHFLVCRKFPRLQFVLI